MASEDVKTSESAVSKFVNFAEEAKLAKEDIRPTKYQVYTICKSLVAGGVAGGVSRTAVAPLERLIKNIASVVVAMKNGGLSYSESHSELYEINEKDSDSTAQKIAHTEQFRWLDKAAILPPSTDPSPWKVCTITQVEEVKILARMLPIIASTIILNTCMAQLQTFSVQQGYRMDPHLGSFQVPAASIPVIPLLFMIILIPIYDRLFVPFTRNFTKHPSGITQLQHVRVGLVLSAVSMAVAALVEVKRKNQSLKNPLRPISLFWLAFQYGIFGVADMFTLVGLLEFYYKEAPIGMKSLSISFAWISQSVGYFLSSVFVDVVNSVTRRVEVGGWGWLQGQDLDRNNLNLFYWFLAVLSGLNFLNCLFWAAWYKYKKDDCVGVVGGAATLETETAGRVLFLKAASDGSVVEEGNGRE